MEQSVEDHEPAPQSGHRQLQQALKSLQVAQLIEGTGAVLQGGGDVLLSDNEAKERHHHQLSNAPAVVQKMQVRQKALKSKGVCMYV